MNQNAKLTPNERILEILESGDFTFVFNDSYYGDLIPVKVDSYDDYAEYLDSPDAESYEISVEDYGEGLVSLLIQALGGELHST